MYSMKVAKECINNNCWISGLHCHLTDGELANHCYSDDSQLYLSMKPEEIEQLAKLQTCLKHIKSWMTPQFVLNSDKTEVIVFGPKLLRGRLVHIIPLKMFL